MKKLLYLLILLYCLSGCTAARTIEHSAPVTEIRTPPKVEEYGDGMPSWPLLVTILLSLTVGIVRK